MIIYMVAGATGAASDADWGNVMFLLNGQGALTFDAGPLNLSLTSTAPIALDSTVQLFGYPTYLLTDASGARLEVTDDTIFATEVTNDEWCYEGFMRFTNPLTTNSSFTKFGQWIGTLRTDASITMTCANIGGTSYGITSAANSVPADTWTHFKFVRDKSDSVFDYLKLYIDHSYIGASATIGKAATVSTAAGNLRLIGDGFGPGGNLSNFRFTAHTRRRLETTVPTAPYPVG